LVNILNIFIMTYEEAIIKIKDAEVINKAKGRMQKYPAHEAKLYIAPNKPKERLNFVTYILEHPTKIAVAKLFCSNNDFCICLIIKPSGSPMIPFIKIC